MNDKNTNISLILKFNNLNASKGSITIKSTTYSLIYLLYTEDF